MDVLMITPDTAAALLAAISRDLHPFSTTPDPDGLTALYALARQARWVADVADAEAHRVSAVTAYGEQTRIARDGVAAEQSAAAGAAARYVRTIGAAEQDLARLMDDRPGT